MVAYPYVSDYLHKLDQLQVVEDQAKAAGSKDAGGLAAEMTAALDYNRRLLSSRAVVTDPFDPSNEPVSTAEYNERLNIQGDGVMASIAIPKLGVNVPIYHGTTDDVLQKGAGHLEATSLPVGGESSHCVVAGHNGLPSVRIFDDLDQLKTGDYFVVQVLGEDHAYRVTGTETVLPTETSSLTVQAGKDLMTLITCTPYGVNTHRLLVHAERTALPAEWLARDKAAVAKVTPQPTRALLPLTLGGAAVAAGVLAGRAVWGRRARRDRAAARAAVAAGGNPAAAGIRRAGAPRPDAK